MYDLGIHTTYGKTVKKNKRMVAKIHNSGYLSSAGKGIH